MARLDQNKRGFARHLRREQTDAEKALWKLLRSRQLENYKFRRQHVIGPFIVDFCCLNPKIAVELDGSHHVDNKAYDKTRTEFLQEKGFEVIRFWDNEVLKESEAVISRILSALTSSSSESPIARRKPGEGGGEGAMNLSQLDKVAVPSSQPSPILRTGEGVR